MEIRIGVAIVVMSETRKTQTCLECSRKFLNSRSLTTHVNRFHHKYNSSNLDSHRYNAEFSQMVVDQSQANNNRDDKKVISQANYETIQNEIDLIKKNLSKKWKSW